MLDKSNESKSYKRVNLFTVSIQTNMVQPVKNLHRADETDGKLYWYMRQVLPEMPPPNKKKSGNLTNVKMCLINA